MGQARSDQITSGSFDACNSRQAARMADRYGIRGPGRTEVQARSNLDQRTLPTQKWRLGEFFRLEGLTKKPGEPPPFFSG